MAELLKINLRDIVRQRIGGIAGKCIPPFLFYPLERLIHQKELNEMLEYGYPSRGWEFARKALQYLNISLDVRGMENIPETGRFIFASNHPLGGLDGIALISVLAEKYGNDGIRFVVNDMLMNVDPLADLFIPVNKYGAQGRERARLINETYASDMQILQFPAGLVSRLNKNGEIKDLEWQKSFITKAIDSKRDIIPVHFIGLNSPRFYKTAYWRKKLKIKFNFEQILLPSEVCKCRDRKFTIIFGTPIPYTDLSSSPLTPRQLAADHR